MYTYMPRLLYFPPAPLGDHRAPGTHPPSHPSGWSWAPSMHPRSRPSRLDPVCSLHQEALPVCLHQSTRSCLPAPLSAPALKAWAPCAGQPAPPCWALYRCSVNTCRTPVLLAQWWRIHLPMQETRVRSLAREDPTCHAAAKLLGHSC